MIFISLKLFILFINRSVVMRLWAFTFLSQCLFEKVVLFWSPFILPPSTLKPRFNFSARKNSLVGLFSLSFYVWVIRKVLSRTLISIFLEMISV